MRFFKISFAIIILVIISFSISAQTHYNLSQKNLIENVEYYQETSYSTVMKNGEYVKGSRKKSWTKDENIWFNKEGNYEKLQTINSDGSVFENYVFEYDDNNILRSIEKSNNDKPTGTIKFTYNNDNKLILKTSYYSDKTVESSTSYKYDEKSRIIEDITNEKDDEGNDILRAKNTYSYDENNKLTNWTESFFDEKENIIHNYLYDENGILIEETSNNYSNEVVEKTTFEYDKSNKLIRKTIERGVYTTIVYEYEYDQKGNCIKILEYKGEKLIFIYEYKISYYE